MANFLGPEFGTLIGRGGKPDIILANSKHHYNTAIIEGEITTSDHIPIIFKLSSRPIVKELRKRKDFRNANWESFETYVKDEIIEQRNELPLQGEVDKEKIDKAIHTWMLTITNGMNIFVPEKKVTYFKHPPSSDYMKILETAYEVLRYRESWTREERTLLRNIQENIREEAIRIYNESWSQQIDSLQEKHKDPADFWKGVKRLMGGRDNTTPHIVDMRGNRIYNDKEKEIKFREIWENVFRINDDTSQSTLKTDC